MGSRVYSLFNNDLVVLGMQSVHGHESQGTLDEFLPEFEGDANANYPPDFQKYCSEFTRMLLEVKNSVSSAEGPSPPLQTSPRLCRRHPSLFNLPLLHPRRIPSSFVPIQLDNIPLVLRKKFKFLNVYIIWRFADCVFISAIWIWGTCCMVRFASCNCLA